MLHVQQYLQSKTLDDLTSELGIRVARHESLPLVILNYHQLDSPKVHPIIRECRGLTLDTRDWSVVAKSMDRFFNWGEVQEEMKDFDFSDFVVQSKEDGSLVLLYHFDGKWRFNTRGSFAQDTMQFQDFTWEEGILKALGYHPDDSKYFGHEDTTYVLEFCSPWNKVVRNYPKPKLFLLTAFDRTTLQELSITQCDAIAEFTGFLRPTLYSFRSIEEIQKFLQEQATSDPTFEGVVIRDRHNRRWKIKNACYLALHKLKGEGDNLYNPKHLLPFVLAGEESELLLYFSEVEEAFRKCQTKVQTAYEQLEQVWRETRSIPVQKDFAMAIIGRTPFTGLLFQLRKNCGENQTVDDLKNLWRNSSDAILKILFK